MNHCLDSFWALLAGFFDFSLTIFFVFFGADTALTYSGCFYTFYCNFCSAILPFFATFLLFLDSVLLAFWAEAFKKVPYLTL